MHIDPTRRRRSSPVLLAVAGAVIIFGVGLGIGQYLDADAGSLADWVAATATVAAFGAAVVAAWYAYGALKVEEQREGRFLAAQETSQASLVAAWWGVREEEWSAPENEQFSHIFPTHGTIDYPGIYLRNASDVPVTDVVADLGLLDDTSPSHRHVEPLGAQRIDLAAPGATAVHVRLDHDLEDAWNARLAELGDDADHRLPVVTRLTFTDGRGVRWQRTRAGHLSPLPRE